MSLLAAHYTSALHKCSPHSPEKTFQYLSLPQRAIPEKWLGGQSDPWFVRVVNVLQNVGLGTDED